MKAIENVLDYIPYGQNNAIRGSYLRAVLGVSDRRMRKLIEAERLKGNIILNHQDGNGYYRPTEDDVEAVKAHYYQEKARATAIIESCGIERAFLLERGIEL